MKNILEKIRNGILRSFQFITLSMLTFCVFLLIYQQMEIKNLNSDVQYINNNSNKIKREINNIESKLDDIESKLDDVESTFYDLESNLRYEIDAVRSTVILYSN